MKILEVKTEDRALGNYGEGEAVKLLRRLGYKILERNFVISGHEIDIIAENKEILAFVEVKTRSVTSKRTWEPRPASAVTPDKQRGIIAAASAYAAHRASGKRIRLDIIEVYVSGDAGKWKLEDIKHLPAAFDKTTAYKRRWP